MKIGIIEEDEVSLGVLRILCNELGWSSVYEAQSYSEWERTFHEISIMPDLFFVNVFFSGRSSGLLIGNWIKTHTQSKLVFVSSMIDSQTMVAAKALQPEAMLEKPIFKKDLKTLENTFIIA